MLLRSITQHVRNQNWFAVVLDFFIVIVGILIAFQITNWNEERKERVQERHIVERLRADFVELRKEVEEKIAFLESVDNSLDQMQSFIVDFQKGEDGQSARSFFDSAFHLPSMVGQSTTYAQLVTSGDMKLLTNKTLVTNLVAHAELTQELVHGGQAVREFMRPYTAPLVRFAGLIDVLPLEDAFSEAGSRADLIVAIDLYSATLRGHKEMFSMHKESLSKLIGDLELEYAGF